MSSGKGPAFAKATARQAKVKGKGKRKGYCIGKGKSGSKQWLMRGIEAKLAPQAQ